MPNPNLQVSLIKPEEAAQYVHIRHETFRPTVNKILYSRGEASQKTLDRIAEEIRTGINKGNLILKCIDTSTGETLAVARWRYVKPKDANAKERTWDEVEAGFAEHTPPYEESDPALLTALFDLFNDHKRKHLGNRPYYVLDTLCTLPQHERKGAGSMLVRWGCERADEAGVQAYLEASPVGAPMYARHGFVKQEEIELDLRRFGGDEVMKFIVSIAGRECDLTDVCVAYDETSEEYGVLIGRRKMGADCVCQIYIRSKSGSKWRCGNHETTTRSCSTFVNSYVLLLVP
jgi:GNAT superfamily N-acetyltransferase